MNEFVALHELRSRISAALQNSPGFAQWCASGSPAGSVVVAVGDAELAMFERLTKTGYVRFDTKAKGAQFLGYTITKSGAPSGVTVSFRL